MKVFISWSGERSNAIAKVFRKYLPIFIQRLEPFMSEHDINAGDRWADRLQSELEESTYGLFILTPFNLDAKWLHFEAGAISKLSGSVICCLLTDGVENSDVIGPLGQYQLKPFTKQAVFQILREMNDRTVSPLPNTVIEPILEKWWEDLNAEYQAALKIDTEEKAEVRTGEDVQKEILRMLRVILSRVDTQSPMTIDGVATQTAIDMAKLQTILARASKRTRTGEALRARLDKLEKSGQIPIFEAVESESDHQQDTP